MGYMVGISMKRVRSYGITAIVYWTNACPDTGRSPLQRIGELKLPLQEFQS